MEASNEGSGNRHAGFSPPFHFLRSEWPGQDEIPVSAQIVGIVDVYDALTTTRPYRPAFSQAAALANIDHCRGHWSEAVCRAFRTALALAGASHQ